MATTITYGSTIQLVHNRTKALLFSLPEPYNHTKSSKQQAVGAVLRSDDNCRWLVKPAHGVSLALKNGQPVTIGDVVRLEHIATRRNLHSHPDIPSPRTGQQEVTAFGNGGEGNGDDNWKIKLIKEEATLQSDSLIRLIHNRTQASLHSHPNDFLLESGLRVQEVTGFKRRNDDDFWVMMPVEMGLASPPDAGTQTSETDTEIAVVKSKRISEIACGTWESFKNEVTSTLFDGKPFQRSVYIFRGHGDPSWHLTSTFDRWFKKVKKEDKLRVASGLLEQFAKECEGLALQEGVRDDQLRMLALAQHHGLPTRLLDWTESPYMAAFFAFASGLFEPEQKEHVAVWALDTTNGIWSEEYGVQIVDVASFGNIRLRHQTGKFTLLKAPYDTLEEFVEHFSEEKAAFALRKYVIPTSVRMRALADLDAMGINFARIYPDLDGSAKAASMRILLEY